MKTDTEIVLEACIALSITLDYLTDEPTKEKATAALDDLRNLRVRMQLEDRSQRTAQAN